MAYTPVSGAVPQFQRNAGGAAANGYYLKGYSAGTTTPLSMGTDSTPTATLAKCALNSRGEPISNDADETTVFIPHFNASYKLVLYTNSTDADNNTTANAVWVVDNITGQFDASQLNFRTGTTVADFLENLHVTNYTALRALTSSELQDGDVATVTNDGIAGDFVLRNSAAHGLTDNGGTIIVINTDWYAQRVFEGAIYSSWFGGGQTGVQAAIDELLTLNFERKEGITLDALLGAVVINEDEVTITSEIQVQEGYGVILKGLGAGKTRLIVSGSFANGINLVDCNHCRVEDMEIYVEAPNSLTNGFVTTQDNTLNNLSASSNIFNSLSVVGNGQVSSCYLVTNTGTDAGNDFHEFNSCFARGYTTAAVYLDGFQSHHNYIRNPNFNGLNAAETAPLGAYGVYATSSTSGQAASFIADGGACGGHLISDYYLTGGNSNGYDIQNISSENSVRFFVTDQHNTSSSVVLKNNRYSSENLNSDGRAIRFRLSGQLMVMGGSYGTNGTTSTAEPKIQLISNNAVICKVFGARFPWYNSGVGNSTDFSVIEPSGTQVSYADIRVSECNWINGGSTTMQSYLEEAGNPGASIFDAFFGDSAHVMAHTGATTITNINASYPGQEIELVFTNLNTTIQHNAGGTGTILLKAAANFTPTVVPYVMKLKYENSFGRWCEI